MLIIVKKIINEAKAIKSLSKQILSKQMVG